MGLSHDGPQWEQPFTQAPAVYASHDVVNSTLYYGQLCRPETDKPLPVLRVTAGKNNREYQYAGAVTTITTE